MIDQIQEDLQKLADSEKAKILQGFFKTGKGQYGEGDVFIGVTVPGQRSVSKKYYKTATLSDLEELLKSEIHEYRLTSLLMLVAKYEKTDEKERQQIVVFYLKHTKWINNWDLIDTSAPYILGSYFLNKEKDILYKFAKSDNIWERRIAMMSTFGFIRKNKYDDALQIAEILLHDTHDLIQKAVGWMLREIGNRDLDTEVSFLNKHYKTMPRTMLRYAIEKFSPEKRMHYLNKKA